MRYILASASPRRKELLEQIGMKFEVILSTIEEKADGLPNEMVCQLSKQKAEDVWSMVKDCGEDCVVIGADTVVAFENEIMGKPKDEQDAKRMLTKLSGNIHQVFTGVTLIIRQNSAMIEKTFYEKTDVQMYQMTEHQIDSYVQTKEPMDKAGSYAIQGLCGAYIQWIHGEYSAVVGLPIARMCQELFAQGIEWQ